MKKILSIILCLTLVLGLAAVVSAAPAAGDYAIVYAYEGKEYALGHVVASNNKVDAAEAKSDSPAWTVATCGDGVSLHTSNGYLAYTDGTNVVYSDTAYQWNLTDNGDGTYKLIASTNDTRALALRFYKDAYIVGAYAVSNETNEKYSAEYSFNLSFKATTGNTNAPVIETEPAPELPAADSTLSIPEANDTASKAGSNYSAGKYYVTGTITEVANDTYGNVYIEDASGNKLYVYGLYSADGSTRYDAMDHKPVVGDTITIYTVLGTYRNSPQAKNAWVTKLVAGNVEPEPTPEAPSDPKQIVDAAFALAEGEKLPYTATLTGVISEISDPYSEQYKNITVVIKVEGTSGMKDLVVFRVKGEGAETLAVGDTITVTGTLINYAGTIEFNSGCTLDKVVKGTSSDSEPTETPTEAPTETPDPENPKDGDAISVFVALMAISAIGVVVVGKKKF